MKRSLLPLLLLLTAGNFPLACGRMQVRAQTVHSRMNPEGNTLEKRFPVPDGFQRVALDTTSFGYYLRQLPLKPDGSTVHHYDGTKKSRSGVYLAVIDMEIGTKNLQQCADAVIRLRSEYLFRQQRYSDIHFNYTNGFRVDYTQWRNGYRVQVNGNKATYVKTAEPSSSYATFRKYLDNIFTYAGTASLVKELKPVAYADMQPGDVLIRGGSPGHAVLVADMAVNNATGQKIFLLVQSYMPAQDIQVLCNPANSQSAWYVLDAGNPDVITPEWSFTTSQLYRFP